MSESLEAIIRRCKKGSKEAQHTLFITYKDRLYLLALKYCRNQEDAEDLLQEGFIIIFEKIHTFKGKGSFEGWMKRIIIYQAINKYRSQKEYASDLNDDVLEETAVDESYEAIPLRIILDQIQKLPNRYRLVFNMFELDGYTHKEIAKALRISMGSSKSNLHRAKAILKEKLQAYLASPSFKESEHER